MLNHMACAIIKQRSSRVVSEKEHTKRRERTRFREQKRDDPCAYAGRGEERDIQKKLYCTVLYKAATSFNVGPCPQRLATTEYPRYRIVATGLARRTRTSAGGTRIYRTKNE